ncbi:MAG: hypothetical protein RLZZ371_338, partial [Pseudomonadota bacterium]
MNSSLFPRLSLAIVLSMGLMACTSADLNREKSAAATPVASYSFGLWGDMPYKKAGDDAKLPAVLHSINASDIAFSIYDGDIKDGSSKCTDNIYTEALTMFNSMRQPVVYIPGDNEWTDCHRNNNGGMDGLERLAHIRKVMFPTLNSLGQHTLALEHQGKLGEKYVSRGGVLFVGINMPGSNNNLILNARQCSDRSARTPAQCDASNAEYLERDAANVAWLKASFAQAKLSHAKGLVVVQADPGFDLPETENVDESLAADYSGYRNFMSELEALTKGFAGQVLFV